MHLLDMHEVQNSHGECHRKASTYAAAIRQVWGTGVVSQAIAPSLVKNDQDRMQ